MSSVDEMMAADAAEAMKLTRKHFVVELDYSNSSVNPLEQVVAEVDFAYPNGKSAANVELLTRVWGAYLGETIRRNFDGKWVAASGNATPQLHVNDRTVSPHDVIRDALTEGRTSGISEFFESCKTNR